MTAINITEAWKAAYDAADPGMYELDKESEERAGYKIYRAVENYYSRICDLGCRLEVVKADGTTVNVWIDAKNEAEAGKTALLPEYGRLLAEKVRATADYSKLTDFQKFVLDRGWSFKTEEALRAGYDRLWKCAHDILITENEFVEEAGLGINTFPQWNEDVAREVYNVLAGLTKAEKLTAGEVYRYAHYKWCLRKPAAIIAYQRERDKWEVNNCGTEITEETAIVAVNGEWGFEASRVQIIGKPYYDATDYQFIRFDCAHMTWLWSNGNLYQVYA